jgi:hypothetical protein
LTWYANRLREAQEQQHSRLAIEIAPLLERIPYPLLSHDDPFLPFSKAIIDATAEFACAYVFDLAAFLSLGASGAIALERAIAYVPAPLLKILHGPFASRHYARLMSESAFAVDAVTLVSDSPAVEVAAVRAIVQPFLARIECGAYLLILDDEAGDRLLETAEELETEFAGQLGTYSWWAQKEFYELENGDLITNWHGATITYASRRDDYREVMHAAAEARRGWSE